MPYFERLAELTYAPTEHVAGAWSITDQHIAPSLGLLVHLVEQHRDARRDDGLMVARLSYDVLGLVTMAAFDVEVRVLRPGRTIELVEAVLSQHGRPAISLRAWLMAGGDTTEIAGTALEPMPAPHELPVWKMDELWPGGCIASLDVRRTRVDDGHALAWVDSAVPLLAEPVSSTARLAGFLDFANGLAVRADPRKVTFPNIDLTAHLFRTPSAGPLGLSVRVSFGPDGVGLTESVLHDIDGPFGTSSQVLTVRPL